MLVWLEGLLLSHNRNFEPIQFRNGPVLTKEDAVDRKAVRTDETELFSHRVLIGGRSACPQINFIMNVSLTLEIGSSVKHPLRSSLKHIARIYTVALF